MNDGISRRQFLAAAALIGLAPGSLARIARAEPPPRAEDWPDLLQPPSDPADWPSWRRELEKARDDWRKSQDLSLYEDRANQWTETCRCCCKIMVWDAQFLDPRTFEYRVEAYLAEYEARFGGVDAVVLWQAYPRIGFDDRNQFDYYRELPGGLDGLAGVVARFHKVDVRVFVAFNPWDVGTRREPVSDEQALADLVARIQADGVFLDTMAQGDSSLRRALSEAGSNAVFETELPLPVEGIPHNQLSWAQWFPFEHVPGVQRDRWLERRHMTHAIQRWHTSRLDAIHSAWMNGAGILVWDNVFGSLVPWSKRDESLGRAALELMRRFDKHFREGVWTPLVPTSREGLFASRWQIGDDAVWTVVNRSSTAAEWPWVANLPADATPVLHEAALEPGGLDLVACGAPRQAWSFAPAQERPAPRPALLASNPLSHGTPPKEFPVLEAGVYSVKSVFRARECGERGYANYPNQAYPPLHQTVEESHQLRVGRMAFAPKEVTNREFRAFLDSTAYAPRFAEGFLRHWEDGQIPAGLEDAPVVYVDFADAEEFANWRGARLPTDLEWQIGMEELELSRGQPEVWNWTSSRYSDDRTRFALLKGGARYVAEGSQWYADGGVREPSFTAKFIEIWPGLDRCATIGFRIVYDLEEGPSAS